MAADGPMRGQGNPVIPLTPYQVTVNYNAGLGVSRGNQNSGSAWFGPLNPMAPVAPPDVAGRAWDFPAGFNLAIQPRAYEPVSFGMLRQLASSYDLLRLVIETRKDQLTRLDWGIRVKAKDARGKPKDATKGQQAKIDELTAFWKRPDGENRWKSWLRGILEDLFVIDAPALYCERTRGGKLLALRQLDGATIKRVIDDWGRTPRPYVDGGKTIYPAAYQEILKGFPAIDYTTRDIIYRPYNLRPGKAYGYSPVEQVMLTVQIALRRQMFQLAYYTEGNVPESLIGVPETWTPEQIAQFQTWWDALLTGNFAERRHAKFVPGGVAKTYIPTKEPDLKNPMDEWLARIICFAFSVTPQQLVTMMNRATAKESGSQSKEEGIEPTKEFISELCNDVHETEFGVDDLEHAFLEETEVDQSKQTEILTKQVEDGVITINQMLEQIGQPPSDNPAADMNMVKTATGYVPIEALTIDGKKDAMDTLGPPQQPGGPGGAGQGDEQDDEGNSPPPTKPAPKKTRLKGNGSAAAKLLKGKKRTLYVMRPLLNADEVVAWAKGQGFGKTLTADDMHVTVAFSRDKLDWGDAGDSFDDVIVPAASDQKDGARSIKRLGDQGAVVLRFESTDLAKRWQQFRDAGASWDWPSFQPHVSITYDGDGLAIEDMVPYDGPLEFGAEQFAEVDDDWSSKVTEKARRCAHGTLRFEKAAGQVRRPASVPFDRHATRVAQASIAERVASGLAKLRPMVVEQVRKALAETAKAKKGDKADEVADDLDLSVLENLGGGIGDDLAALASEAADKALAQLGVDDASELVDQVNEAAVAFARDRAAELVGMRVTEDGLVPNPDAEWAITDSTRDQVRDIIAKGLEDNIGLDAIAANIEESAAFSTDRAELIAATEVSRANSSAALIGYQGARDQAGVNVRKEWLITDEACDDCQANADEGAIDLDDDFPSGDDAPPAHPNCRCALSPVVDDEEEDDAADKAYWDALAKGSDDESRDERGRWTNGGSSGAGEAQVKAEIAAGRAAMAAAIDRNVDTVGAMGRPDLEGRISFYAGDKAGGIEHIVATRGRDVAMRLPNVIARGTMRGPYKTPQGRERIDIDYKGYRAVISPDRHGSRENWLVTGFRKK